MRSSPSLVALGRELVEQVRELVRKEIELAKVELVALVKTNVIAVGLFLAAALLALVMLVMLQVAFILTFPVAIQFIVAWSLFGFWLIVVVLLALIGRAKLKFEPPEKTISTIKGDIEWAKGQIHSNGKS